MKRARPFGTIRSGLLQFPCFGRPLFGETRGGVCVAERESQGAAKGRKVGAGFEVPITPYSDMEGDGDRDQAHAGRDRPTFHTTQSEFFSVTQLAEAVQTPPAYVPFEGTALSGASSGGTAAAEAAANITELAASAAGRQAARRLLQAWRASGQDWRWWHGKCHHQCTRARLQARCRQGLGWQHLKLIDGR